MEDIEHKIGQILSDPNAMASILSMAKGLGLGGSPPSGPPSGDPAPGGEPDAAPPEEESPPGADFPLGDLPFSVAELLSEAGKMEGKQVALFQALKPFIKPGRRDKIDRAMKAARISRLAGYAIKKLDQKEQSR